MANSNNSKNGLKPLTDKQMFDKALRLAMNVDFVTSVEEVKLYSSAIYNALKWANNLDKKALITK